MICLFILKTFVVCLYNILANAKDNKKGVCFLMQNDIQSEVGVSNVETKESERSKSNAGSESGESEKENAVQKIVSTSGTKTERNWVINTGNIAVLSSSLSLVLAVINKLVRMLLLIDNGLVIFMYILSAVLSTLALVACIKNGFKAKDYTIDAYLTGVSFIVLILI